MQHQPTIIPRSCALLLCLLLGLAVGCGESYEDDRTLSTDESAALFALQTKHRVLLIAETYQDNPGADRSTFSDFAEGFVEGWESEAVGEHAETYNQIASILQDLQGNLDQPDKIKQLAELAEGLPGDLDAYREQLAELAD